MRYQSEEIFILSKKHVEKNNGLDVGKYEPQLKQCNLFR